MSQPSIVSVQLIIGLEVHVELATRTKMFSRCPSIACREFDRAAPNTCIDPVTLGLPGALPVLNRAAVGMAMKVGMALGCSIASTTRWDRKSYFYPDMPKNYQISQYDLPLCFDGSVDLPAIDASGKVDWEAPAGSGRRIGIIRAHLEEDAGKLLHEAPGGLPIDHSIVDLNRAGTPLLEIVTQPDFRTADEVVFFCRMLRNICRFLGASEGVLQKGHMRFEPNINCRLTLADGHVAVTPIVEVKNLNSFKAVRGAIAFEAADQPRRWLADRREAGAGSKSTRGWDDAAGATVPQREKEEAADYRYFPDPDLLPVQIDAAWREQLRAEIPELPAARLRRYVGEFALGTKEAAALADERDVSLFYDAAVQTAERLGVDRSRAGKQTANILLQFGAKRANELGAGRSADAEPVLVSDLGISAEQLGSLVKLRESNAVNNASADELFGLLCEPANRATDAAALAARHGMLIERDDSAIDAWCAAAVEQQPQAAADVRAGKDAAIGRLVGAAMKQAGGKGDAATIRQRLLTMLRP